MSSLRNELRPVLHRLPRDGIVLFTGMILCDPVTLQVVGASIQV